MTLIEWCLSFPLLLGVMTIVASSGTSAWKHIHCVHQLFEAAHSQRIGPRNGAVLIPDPAVQSRVSHRSIVARTRCPLGWEQIELPFLEPRP